MIKIPELLAPVGGLQQLKAAVENGADAVYLGGKLMNARINADNFDDETMKEAVSYAHLRNVKVYVTMNILIKDDELEEALQYAKKLYEMGIDALIIQDLGLARLLRRRLPAMRLHLSTQGTVYNLSGVRLAKKLGFERVVLAREVSLNEITEIKKNMETTKENSMELEVFVHGALCICYSGQCQMSRILGGRSGNRGMCAQPCRLGLLANGESQNSYLLSPKDLCTIDYLGELSEAGVSSLKIEGRMKSPEYVAIVTGIYRKYLDEYKLQGKYKVSDEDRHKLEQIFNRGNFTTGYLNGNPEAKLMSSELSKHQGVYIGKVVASAQRELIDIELFGDLAIGDGIEVRNKHLPGNVVTYIKPIKDNIVRIGDIKGHVRAGDKVYKITDKALMNMARESFEGKSSSQKQQYKKSDINAKFKAKVGEYPQLTLEAGEIKVTITGDVPVENAINKPLTMENVTKQLNKTGDVPFNIVSMDFDMGESISLPTSVINKMRREALEIFIEEKTKGRTLTNEDNKIFYELEQKNVEHVEYNEAKNETHLQLQLYFHTIRELSEKNLEDIYTKLEIEKLNIKSIKIYMPLYEYGNLNKDDKDNIMKVIFEKFNASIVPYLPNITKGKYDTYIKENFEEILICCKETGVSIGNLGWINEFKNGGVPIYADYGLNIYNQEAIGWVNDMGICDFVPSHEIYNNPELEAKETNEANWKTKYVFAGAIPLMTSEHLFGKESFVDRKNMEFLFDENKTTSKSIITRKDWNMENINMKELIEEKCKIVRIYFN